MRASRSWLMLCSVVQHTDGFRYKETLLGGTAPGNVPLIEPNNPNNVLVKKLAVIIDGKPTQTVDLPGTY